jgi:hypothetical protein
LSLKEPVARPKLGEHRTTQRIEIVVPNRSFLGHLNCLEEHILPTLKAKLFVQVASGDSQYAIRREDQHACEVIGHMGREVL